MSIALRPAAIAIGGQRYPLTLTVLEYQAAFEPTTGRDAIYAAIARGEIPAIRRGRSIRVLTIDAARALGFEVDREGPDTRSEEPPGSDSSKDLTPTKDRPADEYSTEPAGQPAASLRAVP